MTDIARRAEPAVPWPPLIYVAAIAISIGLHAISIPCPGSARRCRTSCSRSAGWRCSPSWRSSFSAIRTMSRAKTTIKPNAQPDHLVTTGPFSFSRNPIYLANTLLMIGVGLISGIAWFLPLALIAAFVTQKLAIEREEKHWLTEIRQEIPRLHEARAALDLALSDSQSLTSTLNLESR